MIWILMEVTKDYESLSLLFLNLSVSEEPNLTKSEFGVCYINQEEYI